LVIETSLYYDARSEKHQSVNYVALTYIGASVGFLHKIVTLVHGYEQDKVKKRA
jgi:hypothetical protein